MLQRLFSKRYSLYLAVVSLIGFALLGYSLLDPITAPSAPPGGVLVLIIIYAMMAQTTSVFFNQSIGFGINAAIWLAAAALFGPMAVPPIAFAAALSLVILQHRKQKLTARAWIERIGFNLGMWSIAGVAAGFLLQWAQSLALPSWQMGLAWLTAAVLDDQINFWLLAGMLWLQHRVTPLELMSNSRTAALTNIAIGSVGAGIFASAIGAMGYQGVIIFMLPLLLSAYAHWAHVRGLRKQVDVLEAAVNERTQELVVANNSLTSLARKKDRFLAFLSHDMQTPLTAIRLYGQMLEEYPDLPRDQRRDMARKLLNSEQTLSDMVSDLILIERMQSGHIFELEHEQFELNTIVDAACTAVDANARDKQIDISCRKSNQPIWLVGDQNKMQRVLVNLLSNAVKYTPAGGSVRVSVTFDGQRANVQVRDSGIGIPPQDIEHVFQPYHRGENAAQNAAGTGLGLSLVKHWVQAHGGDVTLDSELGEGSTFTVTLPMAATARLNGADATTPRLDSQPSLQHRQQSV